MANNSHTVQVMGYVNPLLEGTTINLSCPMGKVLTGTTSMITCMPNGEWEPDPKFICKGEVKCVYHNTIYQMGEFDEGDSSNYVQCSPPKTNFFSSTDSLHRANTLI